MKNTIEARFRRLGIREEELAETFARSSGPGGQNVNKVSTAVTLRWRDFQVTVSDSRSQSFNRGLARERLCDAVEAARAKVRADLRQAREKERRRNAKRPAGVKKRILDGKRRRSDVKKLRGRVD